MHVVTSNKFEALAEALSLKLSCGDAPLKKRLVVFPSKPIKDWVMVFLAKRLGIAAGARFLELGAAIQQLAPHLAIPSVSDLALHIEWELRNEKSIAPFVRAHPEKRRQYLARELATAFLKSGQVGGAFHGWQAALHTRLFSIWDKPEKLLDVKGETEVMLFGMPYLPPLMHRFFSHFPGTLYLISPSREFWGDMAGKRERARLLKKSSDPQALYAYFEEEHRLLANLGRVGREHMALWEEHELEELYVEPQGKTTLERIQRELLFLEERSGEIDTSIQIHAAPSKLREVEVMHAILMGLFANDHTLTPSDIAIYAPDIGEYASLIELVFKKEFPLRFYGLDRMRQNEYLQALSQLLTLLQGRFEGEEVLKLLSYRVVRERWNLEEGEVSTIERWVEEGNVRWGYDCAHRDALLRKAMVDRSERGAWKGLFTRLMQNLATNEDMSVPFSEAETAGKCIRLVQQLHRDAQALREERSVREWALFLKGISDTYLQSSDEGSLFFTLLDKLMAFAHRIPSARFSFTSIAWVIQKELTKKAGQHGAPLQSITCSSMTSGSAIPAKSIYVLGMSEENYPHRHVDLSIAKWKGGGYAPSVADEEKHLFLELFLAAKERFICSYAKGENEAPSSVVQELISYTGIETVVHPPFPFHKQYFSTQSDIRSYSQADYEAACQYYGSAKVDQAIPRPLFTPQQEQITLRELAALARHPIRFYLNKALGVYLEREKEEMGEFEINALARAIFRKEALLTPFDEMVERAKTRGLLPLGPFGTLSEKQLLREQTEVERQLKALGVEEISSIDGIELIVGETRITGTLENVTPQGLLFLGEGSLGDLLAAWPLALVFAAVTRGKNVLFSKKGKVVSLEGLDPLPLLESYISYYKQAIAAPSPLMPTWAESIFIQDSEAFLKAVKGLVAPGRPYVDPYVAWGISRLSPTELYATWSDTLATTFAPFLTWSGHATV